MKVFISFDERHDRDLYQRFIEQSRRPGASFDVVRDQSTAMRADEGLVGSSARAHPVRG